MDSIGELCERMAKESRGLIRRDEPMAAHTTFRIGGPAEVLFIPQNEADISVALRLAAELEVPVTPIGKGSNLLVSDDGVKGVVMKIAAVTNGITREGNSLIAGAGVRLASLCKVARRLGLGGLDFLVGIPGTVGGAICMNAGAFGKQTADFLDQVYTVDKQGEFRSFQRETLEFNYRASQFLQGNWVLYQARLQLEPEEPESIRAKMLEWVRRRKKTLPGTRVCAGSIFKNPRSQPAGELLEAAGCKGLRVGDAIISHKHANFILNCGRATCKDVLALMTIAREKVYNLFGEILEPEVVMLGVSLPGDIPSLQAIS